MKSTLWQDQSKPRSPSLWVKILTFSDQKARDELGYAPIVTRSAGLAADRNGYIFGFTPSPERSISRKDEDCL